MNLPDLLTALVDPQEGLGAAAQLAAIVLFAKANTLWRSPGMIHFPYAHLMLRGAFALLFLGLMNIVFSLSMIPQQWTTVHGYAIALGFIGGYGLILFSKGLSLLPSKLVFFGGSFQLITGVLVGSLVLGESLNLERSGLLAFLMCAQSYLIYQDRSSWLTLSWSKRVVPLLIGIIWGVYYPLVGLIESELGIWQTIAFSELGVFLILAVAFLSRFKSERMGLSSGKAYFDMGQQAFLSISAQSLTVLCLKLGGIIFQSILSSFSNIIYLIAFRVAFNERFDLRYIIYFLAYGLVVILL